jgi:hypothetical protein
LEDKTPKEAFTSVKPEVSSMWLYKIKHATNGSIEKFKATFMAKGSSQKGGVDYEETFSPLAKHTSIRVAMSLLSFMGWKIHQMDVKTAFLRVLR